MKSTLSMVLVLLLCSTGAMARSSTRAAPQGKGPQRVQPKHHANLGTSFRFDGSAIHGKLPTSSAATITVENDKFLDDLIFARKDFSDREARNGERH